MTFAFDRDTVRRFDQDGRLHVSVANLSKAKVDGYLGSEIPDGDRLGLQPSRVYMLLRDPDELAAAAKTFASIPLLKTHVPISADEPRPDLVVGCIGSDARFEAPYLRASLVVWDGAAIAGIETEDCRELSCGYRYVADMTPGSFKGQRYDGVMRRLVANHVALVPEGRVGPEAVIGDGGPRRSPKYGGYEMFPGLARIRQA